MSGIMLNVVGGTFGGLPAIGAAFGGGFFAGQIDQSGSIFNIVVGPVASAQSTLAWKNVGTATTGADSDINGPQNTADMVAHGNATVYPCAHFCNDLSTGGQTDWYMPAKNELEICYFNLKPTTQLNTTGTGINPNAVPARTSNYTTGNPAQTSATDFKDTGAEDFANAGYWTSTEFGTTNSKAQEFANGSYNIYGKVYAYRVRAIRRVAA